MATKMVRNMNAKEALEKSKVQAKVYKQEADKRALKFMRELIDYAVNRGQTEISNSGWDWYNQGFNDNIANKLRLEGYYVRWSYTGTLIGLIGWGEEDYDKRFEPKVATEPKPKIKWSLKFF